MSFTDQKPRVATAKDISAPWGGDRKGNRFRCYLCGHKFQIGDVWRWVMTTPRNFVTCETCDGNDVKDRFISLCADLKATIEKYPWKFDVR